MRDWDAALALARTLAQRRPAPLDGPRRHAARDGDDPRPGRRRPRRRLAAALPRPARRRAGPGALPGPRRPVRADRDRRCGGRARWRGPSASCAASGRPASATAWRRDRFRAPDLRDTLWAAGLRGGHAGDRDRLDDACRIWPRRSAGRCATAWRTIGERVHAFSHLSHVYPTGSSLYTTVHLPARRRSGRDPGALGPPQDARRARSSPPTARRSATSTASGSDHAPYLAAEKGPLGMAALGARRRSPRSGRPHVAGRPARPSGAAIERPTSCSRSTSGRRASGRSSSTRSGTSSRMARVPIEPYVSPQPGWAEQDPELYWRSIGEACRRVLAEPAVRRDAIAGVALTTQRGTVVVTDDGRDARCGRRSSGWTSGARRTCRRSAALTGLAFRALGVRDTVAAFARRLRGQLDPRQRAGDLGGDPPLPAAVGLPDPPTDRAVRRLDRGPGRLPAVRLQAPPLGGRRRLEVAARAGRSRPGCRSSSRPPAGSAS